MEKPHFDPVSARSGAQAACQINPEYLRIPLICGMLAFMAVHSGFHTKIGQNFRFYLYDQNA